VNAVEIEAQVVTEGVRVKQVRDRGRSSYVSSSRPSAGLAEKIEQAKGRVSRRIAATSDATRKTWLKQVMSALEAIAP
jgi:hypothetical protein